VVIGLFQWLESLLSGCIVVGQRPDSTMARDMLDWPDATIELPQDPQSAADTVETLLNQRERLQQQRAQNISQMLRKHDWRYRIQQMCDWWQWPVPELLGLEIDALERRATAWSRQTTWVDQS
jgi:hypothetical protein